MRIESDGHSRGNPRLYELIEHAPKTGKSPTVWAWPELIDYLKVAGQPVHKGPKADPLDHPFHSQAVANEAVGAFDDWSRHRRASAQAVRPSVTAASRCSLPKL